MAPPGNRGKQPLDMLGRFCKDEAGASAVEYSVLLGLIVLLLVAALPGLGQAISNCFASFATTVATTTGS